MLGLCAFSSGWARNDWIVNEGVPGSVISEERWSRVVRLTTERAREAAACCEYQRRYCCIGYRAKWPCDSCGKKLTRRTYYHRKCAPNRGRERERHASPADRVFMRTQTAAFVMRTGTFIVGVAATTVEFPFILWMTKRRSPSWWSACISCRMASEDVSGACWLACIIRLDSLSGNDVIPARSTWQANTLLSRLRLPWVLGLWQHEYPGCGILPHLTFCMAGVG